MKQVAVVALSVCLAVFIVSAVSAVPPGKVIEFTRSPMGKVVFDGSVHAKAVESCKDCHKEGLFPEKRQGAVDIKMKDIFAGKYCGVCHNGEVTFNATQNCNRCHKK